MSGQTTTTTTFGDATPSRTTTTALPTGGPLRWLAVPSGEWSPCGNFTLQWQGGRDPYALQPIVTYGNGSSLLGVTRTNLVTDHYEYLAAFEVRTAVMFQLTDRLGETILSESARIVESGLGVDVDTQCLNNNNAVVQPSFVTTTTTTKNPSMPTELSGEVAGNDQAMRALGKSSTALGVLLALAILLASFFAYLFHRTKRQYRLLEQKYNDRHHDGKDTEKTYQFAASVVPRKATLHRLSTTEARDAVLFSLADGASPSTPLSGTAIVSGSRQMSPLQSPDSNSTPHDHAPQNPFESDDQASLRVSEQHRYSSISYVSDSDRTTSIAPSDASALDPSEAGECASMSRQSLYSDVPTVTTDVSNPVSDAHYHRTQARTIRRLL